MRIGITDHVEGTRAEASASVYSRVIELAKVADEVGIDYFWLAEHHVHIHRGHLPSPLLMALHLAGQTRRIRLGTAVICLNLHNALDVAEQVAVADTLACGRLAPGMGSGSTPAESELFNAPELSEEGRHARFEASLHTILRAWRGEPLGEGKAAMLPTPSADLPSRCWVAVNSAGAAQVAGRLGFNVLFSHLRTPAQYQEYQQVYRLSGGKGLIAANRPVYVGADDLTAREEAEPAVRALWTRFQAEGKISASATEPEDFDSLCQHPLNFIVGGPETVSRSLRDLHHQIPFDVANLEVRWEGLPDELVAASLRRLGSLTL